MRAKEIWSLKGILALFMGIFIYLHLFFPNQALSFIFDDFEYHDLPCNHGWLTGDPPYPVMGYGVGYGLILTKLDLGEGSRVLKVESLPSVFNRLQPYCMANYNLIDPQTNQAPAQIGFSYKVKSPRFFERFTRVDCYLLIKTKENEWMWLDYFPCEDFLTDEEKEPEELENFSPSIKPPKDLKIDSIRCIGYHLGREIQDATWHLVIRNIQQDLDQAVEAGILPASVHLEGIYGILFSGNEYSLDEITFSDDLSRYTNRRPSLVYPGPQFATLFEPFELILYANDREKDLLTFDVRVGGWGVHGIPTEGYVEPMPYDPNDSMAPYTSARAIFRFIPQYFENLILTITVHDKYNSDVNVTTLSVVNYPIVNNPPVIQRTSKAVAHVDEPFKYQIKVFDKDGDKLTYAATIDGLPNYQYGPWQESIIDPHTGLIQFTPRFEGNFRLMIIVCDEKGAISQVSKKVKVTNLGTWLNHSPSGTKIYSPQLARSGELYTLVTSISDPDEDKLYYSTNIGSISSEGVYSFLTYLPGQYNVMINAYDIHGACAHLKFVLDVQPFWSY